MRPSDDSSQPGPSGRDEAAVPGTNRSAPNADVLRAPLPRRGDAGEDEATAVSGDDDRRPVAER